MTVTTDISELVQTGQEIKKIPVRINYDIIRLFSEGLYKSPHKAIEELVSNGFDADARRVHILLPVETEDNIAASPPLWVIDDGHGMNQGGFDQLWNFAESEKASEQYKSPQGRLPIGQFGIGKLAAYVLAWKLTYLSRVDGKILLTMMNFRDVTGRQNKDSNPVEVSLREVNETVAKTHLAEIEHRDSNAWRLMFDDKDRAPSWTAAALTDFRDLYNKISAGRLRWVLSTGLPLHANFNVLLNGEHIESSKEQLEIIKEITLDEQLPGIGKIKGIARIHNKELTGGKSERLGRSHGFFIRVRGRVINLEDELFGVRQLNHAAWSRFALEIDVEGLRKHLLSSREGVRDSEDVQEFRNYLHDIFNKCRTAYDKWNRRINQQFDIDALISDSPNTYITEPLFHSVRYNVETGEESFYIDTPQGLEKENIPEWLEDYQSKISKKLFESISFKENGSHAPVLRYYPAMSKLVVNSQHPFVDKLIAGDKGNNLAKLVASSEVLLEGQLQDRDIDQAAIRSFLEERDRGLRLISGEGPPTANQVLRFLQVANQNPDALERATGATFQFLGFGYEPRGGNKPGTDGVLYARLGRQGGTSADYKLVYDAKQTGEPTVEAGRIDLASLEDFRKQENANFGFFIAAKYAAEQDPNGKVNRKMNQDAYGRLVLLKVEHLTRLVQLHYKYGVTLTALRSLFKDARTVPEVDDRINSLKEDLRKQEEVPLQSLLEGLEQKKSDLKAIPNIHAVREACSLQDFEVEQLIGRLKAVERIIGQRWIEVSTASGEVVMHQTANEILNEFRRNIDNLDSAIADKLSEVGQ